MSLSHLANQAWIQFHHHHGRPPTWLASAPGRVNLIGEHTDYNDGFVLPMAIQRHTVIVAAPRADALIVLRSARTEGEAVIDLAQPITRAEPKWANYCRGVIAGFLKRGLKSSGFDAWIDSDVPLGGGLSSSAALEVATATLLEGLNGTALDPVEKALLCQQAEHEFAGVPCGIMDQFTSAMAEKDHLLLLDCRSHQTELVPMQDKSLAVLIVNTNIHHELSDGEYAKRRAQCESAARALGVSSLRDATLAQLEAAKLDPVLFRRARHVITEIARTVEAAGQIPPGNWGRVGELMYASHVSLRDDFEVSCAELDFVVEQAERIGANGGMIGCRMTGGGFGGCAVALVRAESVAEISRRMEMDYRQRTGIAPSLFVSRPERGTFFLKLHAPRPYEPAS